MEPVKVGRFEVQWCEDDPDKHGFRIVNRKGKPVPLDDSSDDFWEFLVAFRTNRPICDLTIADLPCFLDPDNDVVFTECKREFIAIATPAQFDSVEGCKLAWLGRANHRPFRFRYFQITSTIAFSRSRMVQFMADLIFEEGVDAYTDRPVERCFVYFDISDFSTNGSQHQQKILNSLLRVIARVDAAPLMAKFVMQLEARLPIGDGFIFIFLGSHPAMHYATYLAWMCERVEAELEIHFRIGIHQGPVLRYWDSFLERWGYVGDGINGGNRVLMAMGKELDDVIFVSAQARRCIGESDPAERKKRDVLFAHMRNRGRHRDKHGNEWRIYELDHNAVAHEMNFAGHLRL